MIACYETTSHMKPVFGYDRTITDITRQCDVFHIVRKYRKPIETDYRFAIHALVGIYYHFLISGGNIRKGITAAADPGRICLNITTNELPDGRPVLSLSETAECLGHILHGMYCFHGKNCRSYDIVQGMGFLVRKIYEPYRNVKDRHVHDIYYALISRGTFVLQMNNEIMARAFYKGLYGAWDFAVVKQKYLFNESSLDSKACFDNLLARDDVTVDPIHDWRMYPWNMYRYNVDNLVLTYSAALEYIDVSERLNLVSESELKAYRQTKDFIHDFFTRISPFYMVRCDYYNNRPNTYLKENGDPVEYYGNVQNTMQNYPTLSMDYAPYLFYTCDLFRSKEDSRTWLYEGTAKNYTHRDYTKLDHICPILGQRQSKLNRRIHFSDSFMAVITASTIAFFSLISITRVAEWEARTGIISKVVTVMIIFVIMGFFGAANDRSN